MKNIINKLKELRIIANIRNKINDMDYADRYDYFLFKPCTIIFFILLFLKTTTIITISWWIVFIPIIIPLIIIWWELTKNN